MYDLGYNLCETDMYVWMKENSKPHGLEYHEYVFIYVDEVLAVRHKPRVIVDYPHKIYRLKETEAEPDFYLGGRRPT